jgi:hypothetical protein
MNRYKWFLLSGRNALVTILFLMFSACFVSGLRAQSAASAISGSSVNQAGPSTFLVAPSFPLGYAPSSVATGDLRQSGKLDLVTADYASGKVSVFLGAGQGKFAPGTDYDAGPHPSAVLVADINGDGKPDVLVCNESEGTISVLLGNGDGTLQPRQGYTVGFKPSFIVTGDFNENGKVDVAVAGSSAKLLAIFLNDGKGNLQTPVLRSLGKTPTALTAADFNNDGRADLAVANADSTVSILLGKGAGLFRVLPDASVATGSLSSIESADLNKDGNIDLIVTQPGQKLVSVLLGKGDGTFAPPASYAVGNEPVSTLVADVNGDGLPDLVVINNSSNTFSVLNGNGDGTFKASVDFVAGSAPVAAVAGDFYGDGHVDLAIINHASQTVSVPSGNGDGTFKAARSYLAGVQPVSIASGNLNGSNVPALVVANYCGSDSTCASAGNVAIFLTDSKGNYHLSSTYTVGNGPVSVALSDVNGDKKLDIIAANRLDKTVSVLLGNGDGTFQQQTNYALGGAPVALAVGDVNNDGNPDLAVVEDCGSTKCAQPGSVEVLLGTGDGTFQSLVSYAVGYSPNSIALGDINGDKNLDIIAANRCGSDATCQSPGTATVLIGNGTGKFTPGTGFSMGNSPASIALGSLTGSGLDLLVSRSTDNTVAVLQSNGDGTFQAAVPYAVGNQPGPLVVADFNGDGKADVATANFTDSTVSVLYGRGDGTLQTASALAVGTGPGGLTAIGGANRRHASLATANGNIGSSTPGTEFTVLPNLQSDPPLGSFVLVPSPTPASSVNQGVLLTATLTGVTPNPAPSGTVTFDSGATALSDCTNVSVTQGVSPSLTSTATCTTQMLTAGTDSLTAVYSGDPIYDPGIGETSPAVTQTVNALPATLTLTSSTGTAASNVNDTVTFTAQLGGATFTPVNPSGTVAFTAAGNTIAGCGSVGPTLVAGNWQATCTTSALVAPSDSITATYSGDPSFTVASAATLTQTVTALPATLTLTSSTGTSASNVNASVTFTAQLGGATFTPVTPSGNVAFTAAGTTITNCGSQSVALVGGNWQATCTTSALVAPSDAIKATYSGDPSFAVSTAATLTQTVTPLPATLTLTSSTGTTASNVNASVTFTAQLGGATFTPVVPSGTVAFTAAGSTLANCGSRSVALVGGNWQATCTTSALVAPSDAIKATYSGDPSFTVSTAATLTQTVNPLPATLVITASPSTSVAVGQQVIFTATVGASSLTPTVPSGTVTFTINGNPSGECPPVTVNSSQQATCTTSSLVSPADVIDATYSGDPNFTFTGTATITESVGKTGATTGLSSSLPTASVNQVVTFTAKVTAPTGKVVPTGSVIFTQGSTMLCSAVTLTVGTSSSTATCNYAFPAATATTGVTVTATFSGDSDFGPGTGGTVNQVVNADSNTTSVTSSPASPSVDQQVTFTAVVMPANTGTAVPAGTVAFSSSASTTPICAASTLTTSGTNATATCTAPANTFTTQGTYTITAAYSGNANFTATSGTESMVVGKAASTTTIAPAAASVVGQSVTFMATIQPSALGSTTVPTQNVTFSYTLSGGASVPMCSNVSVSPSGNNATASCTFALPTAGFYTVSAAYSGDSNYLTSTGTVTQTVNPASLSLAVASSFPGSPSSVNQPVTFTATLGLPYTGTKPSSTVTFNDTSTGLILCANEPVSGSNITYTASCNYTPTASWTAKTHLITATYNPGDPNFSTIVTPVSLPQVVNPATATATLTSSAPATVVATQVVVFTATLATTSGAVVPSSTFSFTSTGPWNPAASCSSAALKTGSPTASGQQTVTATCTATFPDTAAAAAAAQTISATYSGDNNFTATGSGTFSQTVQTLSISNSVTPAVSSTGKTGPEIFLTQGYSTATSSTPGTDPFNPTSVSLVVLSTNSFSDQLNVVCQVTNNANQAIVTDPSCTLSTATPPPPQNTTMLPGTNGTSLIYTLKATSSATIGAYTVTLTATDNSTQTLSQQTILTAYVVGVAGPLSQVPGASATENVTFNTASATPSAELVSIACGTVVNTATGAPLAASLSNLISCTGPNTTVTAGGETQIPVTIVVSTTTSAQLWRSSTVYAGLFLGIPLFALMGWVGSRKLPRKNFFRFIGLILMIVIASYAATGCGGSFTKPTTVTTNNSFPAGNYLVQVVATDNSKPTPNKYYAVVPLTVNSN